MIPIKFIRSITPIYNLNKLLSITIGFIVASSTLSASSVWGIDIYRAQGEMTGEVTESSAIVQTRLTAVTKNVNGDVSGAAGVVRFEYAEHENFRHSQFTEWQQAIAKSDYIVKAVLRDLKPDTTYYYRVRYGVNKEKILQGETCRFHTLQGAIGSQPVSFVVVTGMSYGGFHGQNRNEKGPRPDRIAGYPALKIIQQMQPDFFVGTGDNVYYDGRKFKAQSQTELRKKWHEQFVQSRFVNLFRNVPTYWEKDDHDHRYNDCDTVGKRKPSSTLGISTFIEQMPVVDPENSKAKTYRTYRVSRDLQIWFVEGRDYRSPNRMPDGPEKTLWGTEQITWLKKTLLQSDATFKLLISPTPMVGPDDGYKIDNHTNIKGFRHEGRAFFKWVKQHDLHKQGFAILCGDRHWQYHSLDPLGIEEFSCGAIVDENARLGRKPGNRKSTDPRGEIKQYYTQKKPSGGFLHVKVSSVPTTSTETKSSAKALFTFIDDQGKVLYKTEKLITRKASK